jgi:splicing factor U2AF subunit
LLRQFFEQQLPLVAERPPHNGPAVETVSINSNGMYGFVEFYKNYDADIAQCMDGMKLNGVQLQCRRPKNYTAPPTTKKYTIPGLISSRVPDGPHKIFLGGLPLTLMDQDVQNIAASFGTLSAFSLIKDRAGMSKGYAFFCYADSSLTAHVCAALNNREIHGKVVACKPANQKDGQFGGSVTPLSAMGLGGMGGLGGNPNLTPMGMLGGPMGMPTMPGMPVPTAFIQLANMVTASELADDAEYKDIFDDVQTECRQFGRVLNMSMPRPPHPSAGLIFLQYADVSEAMKACQSLAGRTFAQNIIAVTYIQPTQWPQ